MWWQKRRIEVRENPPDYLEVLKGILEFYGATELFLRGFNELWVFSEGSYVKGESPFPSDDLLLQWVQDLADLCQVRLDPVIGSGGGVVGCHRWHAVLPPLSQDGVIFVLRKHQFQSLTLDSFRAPLNLKARIVNAFSTRQSLLICGPTASGKSSLLAALLRQFAARERVITLESVAELPLHNEYSVRLCERHPNPDGIGGVSLEHLVREALRLTPDRLVLGEIRGIEARAWVEALFSGHSGLLATIHAGSAAEARARLSMLAAGHHDLTKEVSELRGVGIIVMSRSSPPEILDFS